MTTAGLGFNLIQAFTDGLVTIVTDSLTHFSYFSVCFGYFSCQNLSLCLTLWAMNYDGVTWPTLERCLTLKHLEQINHKVHKMNYQQFPFIIHQWAIQWETRMFEGLLCCRKRTCSWRKKKQSVILAQVLIHSFWRGWFLPSRQILKPLCKNWYNKPQPAASMYLFLAYW